jgi:hypothetical protein
MYELEKHCTRGATILEIIHLSSNYMKHFTLCGGSDVVTLTALLWLARRFCRMVADKVASAKQWSNCVDTAMVATNASSLIAYMLFSE